MAESIIRKSIEVRAEERSISYGHPCEDFGRTAQMWTAILGLPVTSEQVGLCLIAVKISRECNAHKTDNLVDMAGYADCIQQIHDYRKQCGEDFKKAALNA